MDHFSDGKIDLSAECLPLEALKPYRDSILLSEPMIVNGDYQVALYTAKGNARAQAATVETLKNLSAIGNPGWASDWQALESLNLKRLQSSQSWPNMLKMVARQRVDFTPAPFLGPELVYQQAGQELVVIRGLKLVIYDSCHYAIARRHPDSEMIRASINRGMAELRKSGRIKQAYAQSGFIYPPAAQWALVNPR